MRELGSYNKHSQKKPKCTWTEEVWGGFTNTDLKLAFLETPIELLRDIIDLPVHGQDLLCFVFSYLKLKRCKIFQKQWKAGLRTPKKYDPDNALFSTGEI
jgi:hypothetical protein